MAIAIKPSAKAFSLSLFFFISILLATLTFTTPIVFGASQNSQSNTLDVAVYNFGSYTVSSCKITQASFVVTNTKNKITSVSLDFVSDRAKSYATLSPSSFLLGIGESKVVDLFINPDCDFSGKTDFTLSVIAGEKATLKADLTVTTQKNLGVTLLTPVTQSCQCQSKPMTVRVQNTGTFPETYTFDFPSTISGPQSIFLAPYKSLDVTFFTQYACNVYGTKNAYIDVKATTTDLVARVPITNQINACYFAQPNQPNQITVCEGDLYQLPIVYQTNFTSGKLSLDLLAPKYVSLADKSLVVENLFANTQLVISPKMGDAGSELVTIQATEPYAKTIFQTTTQLNVESCYDFNAWSQNYNVCPGQDTGVPLYIQNLAQKENNVTVFSGTFNQTILIAPNQTGQVLIPTDGINQTSTIYATVVSGPYVQEVTIGVDPKDAQACYAVSISPITFQINNSVQVLPVQVEHIGLAPSSYDISVDGPQWLTSLNNSISLSPNDRADIYLQTEAPLDALNQTYDANVTLTSQYLVQVQPIALELNKTVDLFLFFFALLLLLLLLILILVVLVIKRQLSKKPTKKVEKKQIIKTQVTQKVVTKVVEKKKEKTKDEKKKDRKSSSKSKKKLYLILLILIFLLLIGFAIFVIVGMQDSENNTQNETTNQTVVDEPIVIDEPTTPVVVNETQVDEPVVTIIPYEQTQAYADDVAALKEQLKNQSLYPRLYVTQNQTYSINLSTVFADPEGDELRYEVSGIDTSNISIEVVNETLIIIPDEHFVGVQSITLTAYDSKGLGTISPDIYVIVQPPVNQSSVWVGIGILIILVLLVLYFDYRLIIRAKK